MLLLARTSSLGYVPATIRSQTKKASFIEKLSLLTISNNPTNFTRTSSVIFACWLDAAFYQAFSITQLNGNRLPRGFYCSFNKCAVYKYVAPVKDWWLFVDWNGLWFAVYGCSRNYILGINRCCANNYDVITENILQKWIICESTSVFCGYVIKRKYNVIYDGMRSLDTPHSKSSYVC